MNRRDIIKLGLAASAASLGARHAQAQAYPSRPIRLVVPFSAGGVNDVVARLWADKVKDTLGTVVVDNKGGAGGTIGTIDVQRSDADGHTVLLGSTSTMVLNPVTMAKVTYDPKKDFVPVGVLCVATTAIVVHESVPAKTLQELIAYAKANPGKLSYGSAGIGTMSHLSGELFKQLTGTDIVHVPYRGAGPGLKDLIAGQIPVMSPNVTGPVIEQHKSGKVRILAVASSERVGAVPEIPTAIEAGVPEFIAELFLGLFVRTGTPQPALDKLVAVTNQALADKPFQIALEKSGFEPGKQTGTDAARRYLDKELERWAPIAKKIGLEPG